LSASQHTSVQTHEVYSALLVVTRYLCLKQHPSVINTHAGTIGADLSGAAGLTITDYDQVPQEH